MSVNWFTGGQTYSGPQPYAFDRAKMLAGAAATFQTTSAALGSSVSPCCPPTSTARTLPPAGAPNYFVELRQHADGLQVPRRLGHPGQLHLDQLGHPDRGRLHPALRHHPDLRAAARHDAEAGRPGRPADVPPGLPQLRTTTKSLVVNHT